MIAPSVMLGAFLFRLRLRLCWFALDFASDISPWTIRLWFRLCLADMLGGGSICLDIWEYVGRLFKLSGNGPFPCSFHSSSQLAD